MADDKEKTNFWTTLPGILTGIAAVITAIGGIYIAINNNHTSSSQPTSGSPFPQTNSPPDEPSNGNCKDGRSCYLKGLADKGGGHWEKAIGDFDKAINLGYEYAEVYYNRGLAYKALAYDHKENNCDAARKNFNKASSSPPKENLPNLNDDIKTGLQDLDKTCQ